MAVSHLMNLISKFPRPHKVQLFVFLALQPILVVFSQPSSGL